MTVELSAELSASDEPGTIEALEMTPEERDAYARKHVVWLTAAFGGVFVLGLVQQNTMALVAGILGLGWIGRAFWRAP